MPGSPTTPGRPSARVDALGHIAFHYTDSVGTGTSLLSRLNGWPVRSPADASPPPSRVPTHGSGPRWFRYAFLVEDLHPLLPAGLPAHSD